MPDPVTVRHPAWLTHRKPRGRIVYESLVRHETQATLTSRDPSEFARVLVLPTRYGFKAGRRLYAHPTGFWELLTTREGALVGRGHLEAYLRADDVPGTLGVDLAARFVGTPVAPHLGDSETVGDEIRPAPSRGLVEDDDLLGEIFEDGRPEAEADLRRFLDGNVALVGAGVALRCRPVALSTGGPGAPGPWRLSTRRNVHGWGDIAASASSYEGLVRFRPRADEYQADCLWAWREACRGIPDPDADLAYLLNAHASIIHERLCGRLRKKGLTEWEREGIDALLDGFAPVARAAQVGLAGERDLAGDLASFAGAVECAAVHLDHAGDAPEIRGLASFVDAHVRPRLRILQDAAIPEEDHLAFAGLAP